MKSRPDTFTAIALNNAPIAATLESQAKTLQSLLQSAGASCWWLSTRWETPSTIGPCRCIKASKTASS